MAQPSYMDRPDDEVKFAPSAPGSFQRGKNNLQRWITLDGEFKPAPHRYHLFVNYGCGWCHQCMLAVAIKGLHKVVTMSHTGLTLVGQRGTDDYRGWLIAEDKTGNNFDSAYAVYNAGMDYGRTQMTTPMFFDTVTKQVVSNDPAHILLMLNGCFNEWAENEVDLYPEALRGEIERVNAMVFPGVNDGVYRCWFAKTDEAYQEGYNGIRETFAWLEDRLTGSDYLCGNNITLADIRAFPHLFRFDVIYHKLMLREPRGAYIKDDNPAIESWIRRFFGDAMVQSVCDLQVANRFYLRDPDSDCDELYVSLKSEWMPSIEELEAKRSQEGLPALAGSKPNLSAAM